VVYIGSQIVIWIVLAVVFGFIMGWLVRGRGTSKPAASKRFRVR
jgi:uncharacterized protein YneF (UPF0154 family)